MLFALFTDKVNAQIYCTPPPSDCGYYDFLGINGISISNINNPSDCSPNGYGDYSSSLAAANVKAGTYVPLTITLNPNNTSATRYITAGIDLNHNGTFEDFETIILGSAKTTISTYLRISFKSLTGKTRLRIRTANSQYSRLCDLAVNGETEDYSINISSPTSPGPNFSFYVNPSAPPSGNGFSWATAFNSLNAALDIAGNGDTIKVAKGIYKPGTLRGNYFSMKDSIVLMGGYPNTGNPLDADRNWSINPTILSGEIGSGSPSDNIPVIIRGANRFVLDGFIIQEADSYPDPGGAISLYQNTLPQFKHCVFRNNTAEGAGSALRISQSSPVFTACIFTDNGNYTGSVILNELNSDTRFNNCIFAHNLPDISIIENKNSSANFTNCDFVSNSTNQSKIISASNNSKLTISNSIFFNNQKLIGNLTYSIDSSEILLENSTAAIANTITQVYDYGNKFLLSKNPVFRDTSKIFGADNLYFTADDGLQLVNPCSPALNAGTNAAVNGVAKDILGNPRIFGANADLGAYEVQSALQPVPSILYVNKLATGDGSGTSWANAVTDLGAAIDRCSDTIKVAAGTYYPSDNDETKSFWLKNKRVLLGGYPNTGNPSNILRDPVANQTILSGDLPNGNGQRSDVIIRGRTNDSTAIVDGFVITRAEATFSPARGGIFLANNCSAIFRNCTITDNSSDFGGGLFIIDSSRPRFEDCVFENNVANYVGMGGGAVANFNKAKPYFLRCLFRNNATYIATQTPYYGGAVYNDGSNPVFDNCSFVNNRANNFAGAMANFNSNPIIKNCKFLGNLVTPDYSFGGSALDMYNDHSSPEVSNTLFADSASCNNMGCIGNFNESNPSFTKCEFRNAHTTGDGSIFYNDRSSPRFISCVFIASKSDNGRGAIFSQGYSNPTLINCIAVGNIASGGLLYNIKSSPTVINCTIRDGISNNDSTTLTCINTICGGIGNNDALSKTILKNSIANGIGTTGVDGNLIGVDPRLVDVTNPAGNDGVYFTNDDGLALCSCSPAINKGLNSAIAGTTIDIVSNPRIFNGVVDMGAYEFQSNAVTTNKSYYVNPSATGNNSGTSWTNAYKDFRPAVQNSCADTIRVAAGIYKPAVRSRDSSFLFLRPAVIMGGYPGNGNPSDADRNADLYPSILSGEIGKQGDSTDNTYTLLRGASIADGLTFEKAFNNSINARGGAINGVTYIRDCRFRENYALEGSAVFGYSNIYRCVFMKNNSSRGTVSGPDSVISSVFENNLSSLGGGIYTGNNSVVQNTIFYGNSAQSGAGAYLDNNPAATFTNCDFIGNNGLAGEIHGVGLYNDNPYIVNSPKPIIRNCVFKYNGYKGYSDANSDWYWHNGSSFMPDPLDVAYSSAYSVHTTPHNVPSGTVPFVNWQNPKGPDNVWFTNDDGLQLTPGSSLIDTASNADAAGINFDILGSARIFNNKIDIGAYEFTGAAPCPNSNTTFKSNKPGVSYQWQVSVDNAGFTNITNNINYSGANTITLQLVNVPSSWYGNRYRALVDGAYSNTFTLAFRNSWKGTIDSTWENPLNWSCLVVPDGNMDVTINSGTVVLNSNAFCRSILINPAAKFTVNPGFKLTLTH